MPSRTGSTFTKALRASLVLVGLLWFVYGIELLLQIQLQRFGIVPRSITGLPGILFSPFLHGSFQHLLANSIPLFILLAILLSNREYHPAPTLAAIWIISGLGTWLIGRGHAVHIGASGVIFGLVAYLIVAGIKIRSWRSVLIALGVLFFYGGIFYGVLPQKNGISWEGHLCGALAGGWIGWQRRAQRSAIVAA